MALQKTKQLQNGIIVNDAYIRIDTISGYKGGIAISVNSYISRQAFLDGAPYLEQKFYTFVPNTNTKANEMWTQGYSHLKSLDEYSDALDLFEN